MGEKKQSRLRFRVAPWNGNGYGPFAIQCSEGGEWVEAMVGLDKATYTSQMTQLETHGAVIEYNELFHTKEKRK